MLVEKIKHHADKMADALADHPETPADLKTAILRNIKSIKAILKKATAKKCNGKHKTIDELFKCKDCIEFMDEYIKQMTPEEKAEAKRLGYTIE
jgi:hypothetical protein